MVAREWVVCGDGGNGGKVRCAVGGRGCRVVDFGVQGYGFVGGDGVVVAGAGR